MTEISILMPVYNAAQYLNTAIQSVINQSFTNWELLCVDDGSSDNSWEILTYYHNLDSRIHIFQQENAGPMKARLLGFKYATGNFIINLDSDDLFTSDLLLTLFNQINLSQASAILIDQFLFEDDPKSYISFNETHKVNISKTLSGIEAFNGTLPWSSVSGRMLIKRSIFEKSSKTLTDKNDFFNLDEYFQRILLLECKHIIYNQNKQEGYLYRKNPTSITSSYNLKHFNRLRTNSYLIKLGKEYNLPAPIKAKIYGFAFCQMKSLLLRYYKINPQWNKEEKKWALQQIKTAWVEYTSHPLDLSYIRFNKVKSKIQTCNFQIFKFFTFLQAKLK